MSRLPQTTLNQADGTQVGKKKPIVNLLAGDDTSFSIQARKRLPNLLVTQKNPHSQGLGKLYLHHNRGFRILQDKALAARQIKS